MVEVPARADRLPLIVAPLPQRIVPLALPPSRKLPAHACALHVNSPHLRRAAAHRLRPESWHRLMASLLSASLPALLALPPLSPPLPVPAAPPPQPPSQGILAGIVSSLTGGATAADNAVVNPKKFRSDVSCFCNRRRALPSLVGAASSGGGTRRFLFTIATPALQGRCGPNYPAPEAPAFGECDPLADADQKGPCCNPNSGWCGNIRGKHWGHCAPACTDCVDFSPEHLRPKMIAVVC